MNGAKAKIMAPTNVKVEWALARASRAEGPRWRVRVQRNRALRSLMPDNTGSAARR